TRMIWEEAMWNYGNDKPDIRFGMKICNLKFLSTSFPEKNKLFNEEMFSIPPLGGGGAELVGAIVVPGCSGYSRKQTDELTEWVKRPQIGMAGLVFVKYNTDGTLKSSVD